MLDWHQYLDGLNRKGNPYVSRLVLFFQYETRLGLAGVTLAAPMMTYWPDWGRIVGVLSIFLYVAGVGHHIELAKYRRRLADS